MENSSSSPGKLRILILSSTPWDDSNSFGSSFSNIFGEDHNYEIANIYMLAGAPDTKVCSRFFQITEQDIVRHIMNRNYPVGKEVFVNRIVQGEVTANSPAEERWLSKFKILRWQVLFWARDAIWSTGCWKNERLEAFLQKVQPDLIFLPIYYSSYMNTIAEYVYKRLRVPMVGYISDDCYTLKQFSLSPLFWIDRLIKRRYVKKSIDKCRILYTITRTQQQEYNAIFGEKCKLLYKGGDFSVPYRPKREFNDPVKLVYTGNLGGGRWKTLASIAEALQHINSGGVRAQLHIYSQTVLPDSALKRLNRDSSSFFHGGIKSSEVKPLQQDAEILIHVESFELSERYKARLSLSTKIVDYLEAGRCIFAVGWKKTGGIEYLAEQDAAVIVTDPKNIFQKLQILLEDPQMIVDYGRKAYECGARNHRIEVIRKGLQEDLMTTVSK